MMTRTLVTRIAQRMKNKPSGRDKNRATFLTVRADVEQALKEGWLMKTIWETLYDEEKVAFGYQTFRRYVHQYIQGSKSKMPFSARQKVTGPTNQKLLEIPGFTFQSNIDEKDLL
jgi:hypothetical protein